MLNQIRSKFLEYFQKKNHLVCESFSIIPENDESLLFINAGMAPLKKFFLNLEKPKAVNLTTAQYCLRVGGKHNDLKDVGYTKRHHTFFEMLGNFSFGGYFKENAINYAWEFLTEVLCLDKNRLYITIHPNDFEAKNFWLKHIERRKIIELNNNKWSMGDVGPWGYCSEIFYDLEQGEGGFEEGDRYLEIWNLVFMEFCSDGKNNTNLPVSCIDTGMGLERIVAVLENKIDTYNISFFTDQLPILGKQNHIPATKIFLDHLRSASHLIQAGVTPSPNVRGYVVRQLLRRMLKAGMDLNIDNYEFVISSILNNWGDIYNFDIDRILQVILKEKDSFFITYQTGLKYFHDFFEQDKYLTANNLYILHDRYGFTQEIVRDLIIEDNGNADFLGFEELLRRNKDSKENIKDRIKNFSLTEYIEDDALEAKILAIIDDFVIMDKTCFYAQGGGQIGDTGLGIGSNFRIKILDTLKINGVYLHKFEILDGFIKEQDLIQLTIDKNRNSKIRAHHSCVHLVQHALDVLYQNVKQMGSYVSDKKFRVDITWNIDKEINIEQVENYITNMIDQKIETKIEQMPLNKAIEQGAKAFFTYDSIVRVVQIGGALELCGGSHISNTSELIAIKILKITPVKAGVKRIEGIAGQEYLNYMQGIHRQYQDILNYLEVTPDQVIAKIKRIVEKKEINQTVIFDLNVNGIKAGVVKSLESCSVEDMEKKFGLNLTCLVIEKDGKVSFLIKTPKNIEAKPLANIIAVYYGYKGVGGKSNFAQTGGNKPDSYLDLSNILKDFIEQIAQTI